MKTSGTTRDSTVVARTIARYDGVRAADRHYVRIKLRTDPLTTELLGIDADLGDVIDVGCGRGQFGLLLHELGRVRTLYGFDWDAAKVASAEMAAAGCARFVTADFRTPPLQPADTLLVFDILQYLTRDEQQALLRRLVASLRPGGRMLIRTGDRARGWNAKLSELFERLGKALGINRSHTFTFSSSAELASELQALGLDVRPAAGGSSSLLDNRLWIAERARGSGTA